MNIGTKSILFGAHCFPLHGWFVAYGWWKLYGFPWDPRLWIAFFIHDLGYWGKPNMDGPEGELHPYLGAKIMHWLFDRPRYTLQEVSPGVKIMMWNQKWFLFCLLHSRYFAKKLNKQPSRLCFADKMAIAITPPWLYLPLVRMSGELELYMSESKAMHPDMPLHNGTPKGWLKMVQGYCYNYAMTHKDGIKDTWTIAR
jgi:hypothetical protein